MLFRSHKRIIFNGNNYSSEWVKEAEERGLLNLWSTVDALPYFISQKNIKLFTKHKIFTESEMHSRYEILMENYCKVINIEALTMLEMIRKDILPAVISYIKDLSDTAVSKKSLAEDINCELEKSLVSHLSSLSDSLFKKSKNLESNLLGVKNQDTLQKQGEYCHEVVFVTMQELRVIVDEIELLVGEKYWPYPCSGKLLFSV